jgi:hypothetical protein
VLVVVFSQSEAHVPRKPTSGGKRTRTPPSRSGLVSSLTEKPAITRLLCCGVEDSGGNTCHMRFISVYIPKVKIVYKLVCILLAKWCVGIGDPSVRQCPAKSKETGYTT